MFLGIFLSYEKMLNPDNDLLKFWFQYHDQHFNKKMVFGRMELKEILNGHIKTGYIN